MHDKIKFELKETGWQSMEWSHLAQNRDPTTGSFECDNETWSSVRCCSRLP
jgi:hypothetical protein